MEFDPKRFFLHPQLAAQRQYEALRAYFAQGLSQKEAATRFGYSLYAFQSLVRDFKKQKIRLFALPQKGPRGRHTPRAVRERIISLRKGNLSSYDISELLGEEGLKVGVRTIERILSEEGFAKLPKRSRAERGRTKRNTLLPPIARPLDFTELQGKTINCQVAGIYFLIPYMLKIDLDHLVEESAFPQTSQLSQLNSVFSILALKAIGQERLSQINHYNFDQGFGLFAGLNVPPKSTAISSYSYGLDKQALDSFMAGFVKKIHSLGNGLYDGLAINLDFHAIPHWGDFSPLEKGWISSRGKALRSALTLVAQDAASQALCYTQAQIKRQEAPEEIFRFVHYWIDIKGVLEQTLVFDSRFTTYPILSQLNQEGIKFITLRRRGRKVVQKALATPQDRWKRIKLDIPKRKYPTFLALEEEVNLPGYQGQLRQIVIKDHGREEPTFIITNNYLLAIDKIIETYAKRWRIENTLAELVDFFNMNALSSPIAIRIHFDILLTMVVDTLYRLLARDLKGFERCTAKELFYRFLNIPGKVKVTDKEILVMLRKRAHTPVLKSNEMLKRAVSVPWWGNRLLCYHWY